MNKNEEQANKLRMTLTPAQTLERTRRLIDDLRARPAEMSWLEFKENNADGLLIGKLISALSNAARLADQHFGYLVWGIRDGDHEAVGTCDETRTRAAVRTLAG